MRGGRGQGTPEQTAVAPQEKGGNGAIPAREARDDDMGAGRERGWHTTTAALALMLTTAGCISRRRHKHRTEAQGEAGQRGGRAGLFEASRPAQSATKGKAAAHAARTERVTDRPPRRRQAATMTASCSRLKAQVRKRQRHAYRGCIECAYTKRKTGNSTGRGEREWDGQAARAKPREEGQRGGSRRGTQDGTGRQTDRAASTSQLTGFLAVLEDLRLAKLHRRRSAQSHCGRGRRARRHAARQARRRERATARLTADRINRGQRRRAGRAKARRARHEAKKRAAEARLTPKPDNMRDRAMRVARRSLEHITRQAQSALMIAGHAALKGIPACACATGEATPWQARAYAIAAESLAIAGARAAWAAMRRRGRAAAAPKVQSRPERGKGQGGAASIWTQAAGMMCLELTCQVIAILSLGEDAARALWATGWRKRGQRHGDKTAPGHRRHRGIAWARALAILTWMTYVNLLCALPTLVGASPTTSPATAIHVHAMAHLPTQITERREGLLRNITGEGEGTTEGAEGRDQGTDRGGTGERHRSTWIATLNVDGRMRLEGRQHEADWGGGSEIEAAATEGWEKVESYLEGKGVVVLTDICANGPQLRAMTRRLEASGSGAWRCHGTPGRFCPADRRVRGGLIILWDENHFTAGELSKAAEVHIKGRLTEVTLQDKAGDMITIVGAYMPTRDKPEDTVRTPWEVLREVTSGRPGVIVAGDLNAELPEALARAGRTPPQYPTTADTLNE